jgi:hypothetical protein
METIILLILLIDTFPFWHEYPHSGAYAAKGDEVALSLNHLEREYYLNFLQEQECDLIVG